MLNQERACIRYAFRKSMGKPIRIQFGAGGHIKSGWINVDLDTSQGANKICDMEKFPYPFPDNYADEILCEMTLEHIRTPTKAINEFHRIIKPHGIVRITVPHFSHAYALAADNHISVFNVGYFWGRKIDKVDLFNKTPPKNHWIKKDTEFYWNDVKVDLIFPKGYLTIVSLPFQLIFNSGKIMQALYEHFFSNFYRACEIHVVYKSKESKNR